MDETPTRSIEWRAVVGAIPGGVAVVVDGRYVHVSTEFADAVGSTADALVGRRWARPFTERARTRLDRDAIPRARDGGRWRGTVAVRSGDGRRPGSDGSPGSERRIGLTVSATEGGALVWVVSPDGEGGDGADDRESPGSFAVVRDGTERERGERGRGPQHDGHAALHRIGDLFLETVRELVGTASREAVERTVCEQLADSNLYRLAWVGRQAFDDERIDARVVAGDGAGYVDEVSITADGTDAGGDPAGRALRTGDVRIDRVDGDSAEPWAVAAREHGFASVAAVPLCHDQTVYGVLVTYTDREAAFDERERAGLEAIGRTVGTIIHAARSRDLLFADAVVELEFDLTGADTPLVATPRDLGCTFSLEGYVAAGERWLLYLSMEGQDPATAVAAIQASGGAESARTLTETEGDARIEVAVASSSLLHAVTGAGANLRTAVAGPEEAHMVVEAPATADTRAIVDEVYRTYEAASLVAHRERDRPARSLGRPENLLSSLTDRQREALEAAYRAGYYDWPRESTAEEVAASLGLSGPTLHGHLRKAQARIFSALIEGSSTD